MPSGKTHDAITTLLAVPVFAAGYIWSSDPRLAAVVTIGFLFGGFMFGPDLDTASTQYSRWNAFRILWFPYRTFFKHRSRWSHGLIFGTLLRVVYLMGIATCLAFFLAYLYSAYVGGRIPSLLEFARPWATVREVSNQVLGNGGVLATFIGMWLGAASHTITDLAGTYVKTGRARL